MGDESMPGIGHKSSQLGNAAAALCLPSAAAIGHTSSNGIWSKRRDDISFDQLQKFWNDLPPHSRRELLRIDKQTLFEQARKNLYCSRCNGLLLEGFSQLVMYGKSLQQDGGCINALNKKGSEKIHSCPEFDDLKDPSIHPWGGLMGTRDGVLTLMDSFIYGKSLRPLQNVFDSARARERERELLYPDACGGGGRGWISQGGALYGRGHGTRETCALHTARLSCETLVDFWSALADDTRLSLLRMKEEDFIERLMYRFDSKRFCRDCRRNVIREFKELKELKRMRREPRCTSWFCVADLAFLYEVSDSSIQVDWHQFFKETHGGYHHFEWAVGTAEGKSDILDFKDVGMNAKVQVDGLDLSGLNACFITLRAWKLDGRCSEVTVKAHGLKGHPCVHRRLMVGEGYVTITKGESIRSFFEHAEEVEEEEDDDSIDKDGSDLDSDGSRPQKHAKSPELAREFLLDAATVIFKEQVEKAFREGTARQNAHSTFVCLALKLLEERVHVACKEIVTLEKQIKLLEEEEREKREEEERRERRRAKEREKKLRRKERLKVKEMERETKNSGSKSTMMTESCMSIVEEAPVAVDSEDSVGDGGGGDMIPSSPRSPDESPSAFAGEDADSFTVEKSNSSSCSSASRKLRFRASPMETAHRRPHSALTGCDGGNPLTSSRYLSGKHRQFPVNGAKSNGRDGGSSKFSARAVHDRCDFRTCACGHNASPVRSVREIKASSKTEALDSAAAPPNRIIRYGHGGFALESSAAGHLRRGKTQQVKQVWEPADPRKKFSREGLVNGHDSSEPADKPRFSAGEKKESPQEPGAGGGGDCCFSDVSMDSAEKLVNGKPRQTVDVFSMEEGNEEASSDPLTASSSSDNCSSCLSEGGDSSTTSSSAHNAESSYVSDSEDTASAAALQPLEVERAISPGGGAAIQAEDDSKGSGSPMDDGETGRAYGETPTRRAAPTLHGSHVQFPVFPLPTAGFPGQSPAVSWAPLVQLPQPHQFVFPHHHHHHLGYSVAGTPPPNFCTPLPPPPPRAAVLRPGHFPSFKAGAVPSEPPRSPNADHLRPPGGGEKESSAKSPSFSLFHFGGPAAAASVPPERPRDGDGPRTEAEVEYSLFSSRFSFLGSLNV